MSTWSFSDAAVKWRKGNCQSIQSSRQGWPYCCFESSPLFCLFHSPFSTVDSERLRLLLTRARVHSWTSRVQHTHTHTNTHTHIHTHIHTQKHTHTVVPRGLLPIWVHPRRQDGCAGTAANVWIHREGGQRRRQLPGSSPSWCVLCVYVCMCLETRLVSCPIYLFWPFLLLLATCLFNHPNSCFAASQIVCTVISAIMGFCALSTQLIHSKCLGLARTIYIRCIYGVFGRKINKNIRSYTVYIYGSGQPYKCSTFHHCSKHECTSL